MVLLTIVIWLSAQVLPQQPPRTDRTGSPVSIVRNDGTVAVAIEHRNKNQWMQTKLEAGRDTSIAGDRIRVSTSREDKAIVTVDYPIEGGKKYRLIWNTQAGIWDFTPAL